MSKQDKPNVTTLSPVGIATLEFGVGDRYFGGLPPFNPKILAVREMFGTITNAYSHFLTKEQSTFRLSVERDDTRYIAPGNRGVVKSLIIFDGQNTHLRRVSLSPTMIRLADKAIFVDTKNEIGAVTLLWTIVAEVEKIANPVVVEPR